MWCSAFRYKATSPKRLCRLSHQGHRTASGTPFVLESLSPARDGKTLRQSISRLAYFVYRGSRFVYVFEPGRIWIPHLYGRHDPSTTGQTPITLAVSFSFDLRVFHARYSFPVLRPDLVKPSFFFLWLKEPPSLTNHFTCRTSASRFLVLRCLHPHLPVTPCNHYGHDVVRQVRFCCVSRFALEFGCRCFLSHQLW